MTATLYEPRHSNTDDPGGQLLEEAMARLRAAGVEVWGVKLTLEQARKWLSVVKEGRP
jgi:hypothetical protein